MCIAENEKAQFKKINMGKRTLREVAVTENCEDNLSGSGQPGIGWILG